MYSIGQMSKMTGVTIRTLDYYDEIDLIKPSSTTEGGHRLYDESDVMRLEQVLALKYMGFSLQQIRGILDESTSTWEQSIEQQLDMVRQEQKRLQALEHALQGVLYSIQLEGKVKWPIIIDIIRLFQHDTKAIDHLFNNYFNEEEQRTIMNILKERSTKADDQNWGHIIHSIRENLEEDPGSEIAQHLAKQWMEQANSMFGMDESLMERMWETIKDRKGDIAFYPMDEDVVNFIDRAITIMFERSETE